MVSRSTPVRASRLAAIALAAVGLSMSPLGAAVAHAKVWSAHQVHAAPPSAMTRLPGSLVRGRPVVATHLGFASPRWTPAGPMRAHFGAMVERSPAMVTAHVRPGPVHAIYIASRPQIRPVLAATLPAVRHPGRPGPLGALGPLRAHPAVRPPAWSPEVRWPIAAGAHPVAPGFIPPSQRASTPLLSTHHAGRR